jgi:transposase-like protein
MSQHFLLSAKARTLSLASVARMAEEEARATFRAIRWAATDGEPVCPKCGCLECYEYASRPIFRCKACKHQFSITSGTIFASRKLPVRDYLLAIAIFVNGAKGHSALQLSRDLNVQYRTAFVLAHKMREAMAADHRTLVLRGHVEIDGAYFGGHVRPENRKADRKDRRLAEHQTGKRRCVVVMRERGGRTLPFVVISEDRGVSLVRQSVATGSTLYADEASSWDALHGFYDARRINHSIAFHDEGVDTNQAESFFSRLRRAEIGQHHHITTHLHAYAGEMAWREDNRRVANGTQYLNAAGAALGHPKSERWCGYWRRAA